ncbi:MAG TPA: NADH-quinone oxidoreductase subunit F [Chitinophagaceae bacterium]|jgi:NADH-quinone oxidoreductase subunit N|nr:NADH-quinone oxidoreductase subunit F [Chitinophagaceae bacterium]
MNSIITSAVLGVIMMFSGIFLKKNSSIAALAILGVSLLLVMGILELSGYHFFPVDTHNMLYFDVFGLLFNCIAFAATLAYFLLNGRDIASIGHNPGEYFALIFFVLCGISIATSFNSLLMLFIGIEIISIPLYILTGSDKRNLKSNEASLKYFLMGSFSTGIMLLGIALLYGAGDKGSFFLEDLALGRTAGSPMMMTGLILLMVSMAFKVSAAPFHFWTPDVYDGAPTVVTSFMATVVKAGAFIAFIRLFNDAFGDIKPDWQVLAAIITATTLFIGNITAVFQQSVKRMLAYSSIAQVGFMLFSLLTLNTLAKEGIILYTTVYSVSTIGLFAILVRMKDFSFEGFNGMARRYPVVAFTATIFLLSLAGIPLTGGFLAKYYMIASVMQTGHYLWLVIFALLCATVSVYYYFRVIQAMYFKEGDMQNLDLGTGFTWMLLLLAGIVIGLGLFPQLLINRLYIIYL